MILEWLPTHLHLDVVADMLIEVSKSWKTVFLQFFIPMCYLFDQRPAHCPAYRHLNKGQGGPQGVATMSVSRHKCEVGPRMPEHEQLLDYLSCRIRTGDHREEVGQAKAENQRQQLCRKTSAG